MKVLIAGDYCPRDRVAKSIEANDFELVFSQVQSLTKEADYSIVNFECPVVSGTAKPIEKQGPNLCCTPKGIDALKWAGFKCVTLANNHFLDYGVEGVKETLRELEKKNIEYVGGGVNLTEAQKILYKEIDGKILAIINCCEHEFSIATDTTAGSNPLNPVRQYNAIVEAKTKADFVLAIVHGGHEHFQLPSPRMVETYRFFIDAGVDAVVNHHQHCFSGYETYKGKPIFYGLGNFCFDSFGKTTKKWNEGYAVTIEFSQNKTTFSLHPYKQCDEKPEVQLLAADAYSEKIEKLNKIISDPLALSSEVGAYYARCAEDYGNIFEPFYCRYYLGAKHRGWVPSLVSKKRQLAAYNFIICEAHRDKLIWWLKSV